ncbi:expansin-A1-like [Gossypium australe]|uniref:Expansin-A1-like n=1 Tax=Gossypium australe TaxID=47621 RepID=A0A5B6WTC1_9ROSI|nr:expansin-A1-like [Gossypium australe]
MIDTSKPLRRIVKLVDREGIEVICALKYERLPDFYFTCGTIGHKLDRCNARNRGTDSVDSSPQFGNWLRAAILPPSQGRVNWRNGVEVLPTNANTNEDRERSNTNSKDDSALIVQKERDRGSEQEIRSASPAERRFHKIVRDGMGRFKSKRKRVRGSNGESVDESPAKVAKRKLWIASHLARRRLSNSLARSHENPMLELSGDGEPRDGSQLLVANSPNLVFVCETKINVNAISRVSSRCRMEGCLAISSEGKSGGLALMWKEGTRVSILSYSKFHVDVLVDLDDGKKVRFTGFCAQSDPALRKQAWDVLRKIKGCVREGWVVGGDFKDILN